MLLSKIFLLLVFSLTLFGNNKLFNQIIHENKINLQSRSTKSWIRTFNSQEKIQAYGFQLSEIDRFTLLKGLKAKQKKSKNRYSRRIR